MLPFFIFSIPVFLKPVPFISGKLFSVFNSPSVEQKAHASVSCLNKLEAVQFSILLLAQIRVRCVCL